MGALSKLVRSLTPGNDHQLAATKYAGREGATAKASSKRRATHQRTGATRAARQGQA